ncbi:hypothetical protein [Microbacterium paulum]
MGRYDAQIEKSKQMLADAEADYAERAARTDLPRSTREFVLAEAQRRIDEAKGMIETFTEANR